MIMIVHTIISVVLMFIILSANIVIIIALLEQINTKAFWGFGIIGVQGCRSSGARGNLDL